MATRIRDGVPGKEKKPLPQQTNNEQRKGSINASSSASRPIATKEKPPAPDKDVPNYLKPTKSRTAVDQPTQSAAAKKTASAEAAEKALLARRRSFGKNPPPVSQLPKTLPSPKEKNLRTSTSFSGSTSAGTNPQKGAPTRIVKTAAATKDVVKKPSSYTKSLSSKKINNATSKKNGESSAEASRSSSVISSPERVRNPEILNVPHPQEDDGQSSVTDEEASVKALSSHVTNGEVSVDALSNYEVNAEVVKEEEEQKPESPAQAKQDIHEQEDVKIIKSPTSEVDNQNAAESSKNTVEAEDQNKPGEETSSFHRDTQQLKEQLEDNRTGPVQAEDQGKEEVKDATEAMENKEEAKEEDQVVNLKETDELKKIASTEPEPEPKPKPEKHSELDLKPEPEEEPAPAPEEPQSVTASSIPVQEEKEASAVSNDVSAPDETQTAAAKLSIPEQENKETLAVSNDVSAPEETQTAAGELSIPVQENKETSAVSKDVSAPEEMQTAAAEPQIPVQGKKETSAVSNDVIEETASKLQEQRKNRVRALAGAFETVIARQDK